MKRALVVAVVAVALGGCADVNKSLHDREIADHQLDLCEKIHDEQLRVQCITNVKRPAAPR